MNSSKEIERQFNRSSAGSYDQHANVQRMMAEQLATALKVLEGARESTPIRSMLEIGCGTGIVTSELAENGQQRRLPLWTLHPACCGQQNNVFEAVSKRTGT